MRTGGVGQRHSRQRALLDICSEAAYPRHHNCLIESIPRGSCRRGSRFGPLTPTSPAPALPAPSRPNPANPCTNSPPAPGRELGADTAARGLLTGAGWLSLQRSERGGKSVNVHKRCLVDYHLGGRACGSSDRRRQQPARSGYWGTFSPPGESDSCRLIYICWIPLQGQSTAGARRSCIWSHLGKPQTHLHIAPH